jgi:hypothetical protein
LINIGITKKLITIRFYDDVQELPLRYYVEEPRNHVILKDTGIEVDMDCIFNLGEPTNCLKGNYYILQKVKLHFA